MALAETIFELLMEQALSKNIGVIFFLLMSVFVIITTMVSISREKRRTQLQALKGYREIG